MGRELFSLINRIFSNCNPNIYIYIYQFSRLDKTENNQISNLASFKLYPTNRPRVFHIFQLGINLVCLWDDSLCCFFPKWYIYCIIYISEKIWLFVIIIRKWSHLLNIHNIQLNSLLFYLSALISSLTINQFTALSYSCVLIVKL